MKALTLFFLLLAATVTAQVPDPTELQQAASPENLTSEIEQLLGTGEGDIMSGIKDLGLDMAYMVQDMLLDELYKALATAMVYSEPAVEIMKQRQKMKDNSLAREIQKLKKTWKYGQEKVNKIKYQQYKIQYAYAKAMNEAGEWGSSVAPGMADEQIKNMFGDRASVLMYVDESYHPGNNRLKEKYLSKDWDYGTLFIPLGPLNDDAAPKALRAVTKRTGKDVYLSAFERMQLARQLRADGSRRSAGVRRLKEKAGRTFADLRIREQKEKELKYLTGEKGR